MPKPYPAEFHEDVVRVARKREPGVTIGQIAKDFGVHPMTLRICRDNGWWSAFGKKKGGKGRRPGPPVHDDRVMRDFAADAPNQLVLSDITEHKTAEGKLYLCAIKDVFSNRIVGYSISDRMKARLAVGAVNNAAVRRGDAAGCLFHTDRGSQCRN